MVRRDVLYFFLLFVIFDFLVFLIIEFGVLGGLSSFFGGGDQFDG